MIVSWQWLRDYVALEIPLAELESRLMMAGFNHESTTPVGEDWAVDFEITSNRPDCLGHIGLAREAAVLFHQPLRLPDPHPPESGPAAQRQITVRVECPELCPRYTARVVRGVQVGPSPAWLRNRLATVGVASINNVVDVTNYVLWESGQPLHAFDLARLEGPAIVVRQGRPGERIEAIDHRTYDVGPGTCLIADATRPVGIGGIMGGAGSEVTPGTTDLVIEAAEFDPAAIRATARRLNLHSDSSYRFERGLDPVGVDWASRRACQLILELAGGQLSSGVIDVGRPVPPRQSVVLRLDQIERVLGITVPRERVIHILASLGGEVVRSHPASVEIMPPSWRRDLEREIDLVEEVARINGYDAIPEDVRVPMAASARSAEDRLLERARQLLTAYGCDEAMTVSLVPAEWSTAFSPWTGASALQSQMPLLRGADHLRRSLVPSLLGARRTNESLGNTECDLFEVAHIYLPTATGLPREERVAAFVLAGEFADAKGLVEHLAGLVSDLVLEVRPIDQSLLDRQRSAEIVLGDQPLAVVGELSAEALKTFELRGPVAIGELRLGVLGQHATGPPQYRRLSTQPPQTRDLNLVVAEPVTWAQVQAIARREAGPDLESLEFRDTYRHPEQIGSGQKSLLFSLVFRGQQQTLTGAEVDAAIERVVGACGQTLGARLRA